MARQSWGTVGVIFVASMLDACAPTERTYWDRSDGAGGIGGAAQGGMGEGGATAGASSAGSSGSGGFGTCAQDADCTGPFKACHGYVCKGGACSHEPQPAGVAAPSQVYGDCRALVCDGQGHVVPADDLFDIFDDAQSCTIDYCMQGTTVHDASFYGESCGNGFCDDYGNCVECAVTPNCGANTICHNNRCVAPSCANGMQDGTESAIDCGGACTPCADGASCVVDKDCSSGVCSGANACSAASCMDGKRNGAEADVDCGGPDCPQKCAVGSHCGSPEDCAGMVCVKALCQAPTCTDGTKNGAETGVDCGAVCAPCNP